MKILIAGVLLSTFTAACEAQTTPGKLSFELPAHPGRLSLSQANWKITELSAKARGTEFGIRAKDGSNEFLGFLYPATKGEGSGQTCREGMLKTEGIDHSPDTADRDLMKSASGVEIATVLIYQRTKTKLSEHVDGDAVVNTKPRAGLRAFVGSGELCGDIYFFFPTSTPEEEKQVVESFKADLRTLEFDPKAKPAFLGAFAYATAALTKSVPAGAIGAYDEALKRVDSSDDPNKWRSIILDQRAIAYAMLKGRNDTRAACVQSMDNKADYPDPYLLTARLDAEDGALEAARTHLQQAFDRRANVLPGEIFPDPTKWPAVVKLKSNKDFWTFVSDLSKQLN